MPLKSQRDDDLLALRPTINTIKLHDSSSVAENFQNRTLRPVIKYQHEILLLTLQHSLSKFKVNFAGLTETKQKQLIENLFQKDSNFKQHIVGQIAGLFTQKELELYYQNSQEFRKRILNIVQERLLNSYLEVFSTNSA